MNDKTIYKIKDSIDLFLSNNKYIMAYFMNTRIRKSFKVNDAVVKLIENIDGEKSVSELCKKMEEYNIPKEEVYSVLNLLVESKIITSINEKNSGIDLKVKERYSRQINYFSEFLESDTEGELAQIKLMNSKILVFGCGAIGGNIAVELAMSGVSNLCIVDYDVVEESDVSRHIYFKQEYIGQKKIDALKKEILKINKEAHVECIDLNMKPTSDIEDLIIHSDFVVNTMDEPYIGYTASKISRICVKHKIPHFIAGGFDAHLASTGELVIPYLTPCVECYAKYFKVSLANWKPKKHPVSFRFKEIGGLASMSLFSTSYACIEIIKYIAGLMDLNDTYKIRGEFLFTDMTLTYLNVTKNLDCPVCGGGSNFEA